MTEHTDGWMKTVVAIAIGIFVVAFIALMALGDYRFFPAVLIALLLAILAAIVLYFWYGGRAGETAQASAPVETPKEATASAAPAAAVASTSAKPETVAEPEPAASYEPAPEPEPMLEPEPEPEPEPIAEPEPVMDTPPPAPEPTPVAAQATDMSRDFDGDGVLEGKNEGTKPATLDAPRGGVADDLKQIKGIGPKLEKLCNSLGFWHFDQVASWTDDEVAWVDANIEGFTGRVQRDTWVDQAKTLAAGGATEFSKRVEGGDVY